jgi:flavorubredoxin
MTTIQVQADLVQFNSYFEPIDLSFNQFLLLGSEPLLVHTGTRKDAEVLLPHLKQALGQEKLAYVFISHFESDECGGLGLLLEQYPGIKPICSAVTARQLSGFGITNSAVVQAPGSILQTRDYHLEFISYPSEMHLWEGLLLFERTRSVLFSSDLFLQFGKVGNESIASDLKKQIQTITAEKIPSPAELDRIKSTLSGLPVSLIAPGHGACMKLKG